MFSIFKKEIIAFLIVLFVFQAASIEPDNEDRSAWEDFKLKWNKVFHSVEQEEQALQNYLNNIRIANRANTKADPNVKDGAQFGENKFSDLNYEDFKKNHTGYKAKNHSAHQNDSKKVFSANHLGYSSGVTQVNWTTSGKMTPPRQQGQCGSCWTFAGTAALEGYYAIVTGNSPQYFSTQQMVDCVTESDGCDGGNAETVFDYAKVNGIVFDSKYKYQAVDGVCQDVGQPDFKIDGQGTVQVTAGNEAALEAALQKQPVQS